MNARPAPLNVALIGCGMVADMHVGAIRATGGRVVLRAILGRDPGRARDFAARHQISRVHDTLDALLGDPAIDMVLLATPPDTRRVYVTRLAAAGIPVLTEKPLARDLDEARDLVRLCETAGVPLGVLLQHRMRPAARLLADRIAAGRLGDIATVELRVPWWREQSYYDAPGRGTYARDGGGVLISQAIHTLDLMLWFCGPVERVQAVTATSALHDLEAEDFAAAAVRFRSGAVGSVMASVTHFPGEPEEIILNGTDASARLTASQLTITARDGREETHGQIAATGSGADPMAFSHAWHQAVIENFASAVADDRPPAITGHSALAVHALIDAICRSARTGREQTVEVPDD